SFLIVRHFVVEYRTGFGHAPQDGATRRFSHGVWTAQGFAGDHAGVDQLHRRLLRVQELLRRGGRGLDVDDAAGLRQRQFGVSQPGLSQLLVQWPQLQRLRALVRQPLLRHQPRRLRRQRPRRGGVTMQRITSKPRENWQATVESQGFHFHTLDEQPYWDESVYYRFTSAQIDQIEKATYALNDVCLKAVEHVVQNNLFERFAIPPAFVEYVKNSWEHDEATVYGRFDLSYDGTSEPKMLEFNADTPTSLLEASVIQWHWMQDLNDRRFEQ